MLGRLSESIVLTLSGPAHHPLFSCNDGQQPAQNQSSALPRLKDRKVIGVIDEDLPEEPHRQQSVEVRCTGILLGACQGGEGYVLNFS